MSTAAEARSNPLAQIDWDYVEFYVGNAKQAAHYYMSAFGFDQIAYAGPETGVRDRVSYLLEQNKLRFVLTASLVPDDEIARHVVLHGDGIKDIAILVGDARAAFDMAVRGGARVVLEPTEFEDASGRLVKATIATYGDTVHSFIQRDSYGGLFAPGFVEARRTIAHAESPACSSSIIASATSAGARWMLGATFTRASSASRSWSRSTTRIFRPNSPHCAPK